MNKAMCAECRWFSYLPYAYGSHVGECTVLGAIRVHNSVFCGYPIIKAGSKGCSYFGPRDATRSSDRRLLE